MLLKLHHSYDHGSWLISEVSDACHHGPILTMITAWLASYFSMKRLANVSIPRLLCNNDHQHIDVSNTPHHKVQVSCGNANRVTKFKGKHLANNVVLWSMFTTSVS